MRKDDMTTEEAAEALGVATATIRQWVRRGVLRSKRKIGKGRQAPHVFDPREVEGLRRRRAEEAAEHEQASGLVAVGTEP